MKTERRERLHDGLFLVGCLLEGMSARPWADRPAKLWDETGKLASLVAVIDEEEGPRSELEGSSHARGCSRRDEPARPCGDASDAPKRRCELVEGHEGVHWSPVDRAGEREGSYWTRGSGDPA